MKILNFKLLKYFLVFIPLLLIYACTSTSNENNSKANTDHNHEHDKPNENETTLTEEQVKTVNIQFGSLEYKQLTATLKVNGNLRVPNNNKANATSMFGGIVKRINVLEGDFVKKGQIIAVVENPEFVTYQEEYINVSSKLIFAEQELVRQKELNEGGAGAFKNLQSTQADIKSFKARKASLKKQLEMMGLNTNKLSADNLISNISVLSPVSGTVSKIVAKLGSYVDVSAPVAEIVDNAQLHLDIQVFEKDLPQLKVGQIIHFTLTNNPVTEYDAKIHSIGSSFEDDSKTIAVHCQVVGNKNGLIDGMNVTALVSLDNVVTPAVPNDAIVEKDKKTYIFIVKTGKVAANNIHAHDAKVDHNHIHENDNDHSHDHKNASKAAETNIVFERVEVILGVSELGYTAITLLKDIPKDAKIVTKSAFFINAKMSDSAGHNHSH